MSDRERYRNFLRNWRNSLPNLRKIPRAGSTISISASQRSDFSEPLRLLKACAIAPAGESATFIQVGVMVENLLVSSTERTPCAP